MTHQKLWQVETRHRAGETWIGDDDIEMKTPGKVFR